MPLWRPRDWRPPDIHKRHIQGTWHEQRTLCIKDLFKVLIQEIAFDGIMCNLRTILSLHRPDTVTKVELLRSDWNTRPFVVWFNEEVVDLLNLPKLYQKRLTKEVEDGERHVASKESCIIQAMCVFAIDKMIYQDSFAVANFIHGHGLSSHESIAYLLRIAATETFRTSLALWPVLVENEDLEMETASQRLEMYHDSCIKSELLCTIETLKATNELLLQQIKLVQTSPRRRVGHQTFYWIQDSLANSCPSHDKGCVNIVEKAARNT